MLNVLFVAFSTSLILGQRALAVRDLYGNVRDEADEYDYR